MTKAAYSAYLRSSPHLDCNETYLSHPLTSHLLRLLSGNLTVWPLTGNWTGLVPRLAAQNIIPCVTMHLTGVEEEGTEGKWKGRYQFSCLKQSRNLHWAGALLRTPAKAPLLGACPWCAWSWHQALPLPAHHSIRATSAFWERRGRNSETLRLFKVEGGQDCFTLLQILASKGAGKWSQVPICRWGKRGQEVFPVPKAVQADSRRSFVCTQKASCLPRPRCNHLPSFLCESKLECVSFSMSHCSSHHPKDQNFILP